MIVVLTDLLDIAAKALAPSLFVLLCYPPFFRWVGQSPWRIVALVFFGEFGIMLMPLQLNSVVEALLDAAGMVAFTSPLVWRMWQKNRDNAENLLRLNTLINTIPDAIFFKDGQGRWLTTNPAGEALFRLQNIPWQGKTGEEIIQFQPDMAEPHLACKISDERAWSKGFLNITLEMITDVHGDVRQFEVTKVPLFERDGSRHGLVVIGRDVTEIEQAYGELRQVTNHDPLTGLPNRRLLNELLEHAIRRAERDHSKVALLLVDLDRFKTINETLGHRAGDQLLAEVAQRITKTLRDSDVTARLGGDEFIVIMDVMRDSDDVSVVAEKIIECIGQGFHIDDEEFYIGASIGISIFPDNSREVGELIKTADIAMYQVKIEGKNHYRFYSSDMSENATERFVLENRLRHAMERNQFEVYYQPQVSLADGRVIGAEALIRWHHPESGMVSPDKFIPLAEETGLIIPIGEWVLRESIMQAMKWIEEGYPLQWVSVNVSGIQIQRSNFGDIVYGVLVETGCEPGVLELEITESTIMRNTEHVIGIFDRIKNMGVSIAIDDFGTGYSSLSHLKRLPLDKLKIDRSFVRDLPQNTDDAAIANAVYALGRSLGLTVIAEGVETVEQADFLRKMGCDEAQGYLYGRPLTATAFTELLKSEKSRNS
jgi:diguanylate cyclase (GGDEF)-like protein/PAS domain S-box-containing protein